MSNAKQKISKKTILVSILSSFILALLKWITGYYGNSFALIADAIESTSDIFSSLLVLVGLHYSHKPADKNHPYGHGKLEPLITFAVVGFLFLSAIYISAVSIKNILTPHVLPKYYTLIILGIIILWKEMSYRYVLSKSKETNSSALKADAWHHKSDAITSFAAFCGILLAIIFGKGYEWLDDAAALLGSGFIIYNAYLIFRPALGEVLDEHLYDDLIPEIRNISLTTPGVIDTEKCHIRKAGMHYFIDLHIIVNSEISVKEGHDIAHKVKKNILYNFNNVSDVLIHVEPSDN